MRLATDSKQLELHCKIVTDADRLAFQYELWAYQRVGLQLQFPPALEKPTAAD